MNVTERMSAAAYRSQMGRQAARVAGAASRVGGRPKYLNRVAVLPDGTRFDSGTELRTFRALELSMHAVDPAHRVVTIERQKKFLLIERQPGERPASYVADFVVHYADGRIEVWDTKSKATRKLPAYVLKRKLMLREHGIAIKEVR